jgi:DNA-binding transcriptional regulator of glucitol operon
MRAEKDIARQTRLVKEAIIEQVGRANEALRRTESEKQVLVLTLADEQARRERLTGDLEKQRALVEEQRRLAGFSLTAAEELQNQSNW